MKQKIINYLNKKVFLFALFLVTKYMFSQTKIDAYLDNGGIFKTLSAKSIKPNDVLSFDLKLTVQSTSKNKKTEVILYLNTKDGYVGIDKSIDKKSVPNINSKNLDFLIETMTKQSIWFTNNGATKTAETLQTNLINTYNNLPFKKPEESVAKSKKYLSNSITAVPFFIDKMGLQKKIIRYCYSKNDLLSGSLKSYLGSYGVGFYNIDGTTFFCVATEHKFMNIEITKIEKVNFQFETSSFETKI